MLLNPLKILTLVIGFVGVTMGSSPQDEAFLQDTVRSTMLQFLSPQDKGQWALVSKGCAQMRNREQTKLQFTGILPRDFSIVRFPKVRTLKFNKVDFGGENLAALTSWGSSDKILKLRFQNCAFNTEACQHLGSIFPKYFSTLDMSGSREFADKQVVAFKELSNLRKLVLYGCSSFTGVGLASLAHPEELRYLDLCASGIIDEGLSSVAGCVSLEVLNLDVSEGQFSAIAPFASLQSLKALRVLSLPRNIAEDRLRWIGGLSCLDKLNLSSAISGDVLQHWKDLNLTELWLPGEGLHLEHIPLLNMLRRLVFTSPLDPSEVIHLSKSQSLRKLSLQLSSGVAGDVVLELPQLEELTLEYYSLPTAFQIQLSRCSGLKRATLWCSNLGAPAELLNGLLGSLTACPALGVLHLHGELNESGLKILKTYPNLRCLEFLYPIEQQVRTELTPVLHRALPGVKKILFEDH